MMVKCIRCGAIEEGLTVPLCGSCKSGEVLTYTPRKAIHDRMGRSGLSYAEIVAENCDYLHSVIHKEQ